eukprot:869592-Amorphochlora_amoeboformis.AAC.1
MAAAVRPLLKPSNTSPSASLFFFQSILAWSTDYGSSREFQPINLTFCSTVRRDKIKVSNGYHNSDVPVHHENARQ